MFTLKGIILILSLMYCLKLHNFIFNKFLKYEDDAFHFYINVKKDMLTCMSNFEFQKFCKWLFESNSEYSKVELYSKFNNNLDLLLTTKNGEEVYVHCIKNINIDNKNSQFKEIDNSGLKFFEELSTLMISENISKGIIISTSSSAIIISDYINKINSNGKINLTILTIDDIVHLIETNEKNELYTLPI